MPRVLLPYFPRLGLRLPLAVRHDFYFLIGVQNFPLRTGL